MTITNSLGVPQESTRPDLPYNMLNRSMKNKNAKVSDLKKINKIVRKGRREQRNQVFIKRESII